MARYDANAGEFRPRYLNAGNRSINLQAVEAAAKENARASQAFAASLIASGKWSPAMARPYASHFDGAFNFEMRNAQIELSRAAEAKNPGRPMTDIEAEFLASGRWTRD